MPGLFSALSSSAGSLNAMEQALNVTQNNVSNASTPGYAAQVALFNALPFNPVDGPPGGVQFGGTQSLRNEYSERFVQQQSSSLGTAQSTVDALSALQPAFDITGQSGLDAALNQFSASFSALSQDPNNTTARQQALVSAQNVAQAFQGLASATSTASSNADQQITATVEQINNLASQIARINQEQSSSASPDPNLDANLHADLENLSQYVNFTSSFNSNGSVNILIGGQTPLVLGTDLYKIQTGVAPTSAGAANPTGTPPRIIQDSNGEDITSQATGGQLGGLLQVRNSILANLQGDTNQPGTLNQLAKSFADSVNTLLTGGQISSGPPPIPGVAMFQYSGTSATSVAQSLSVTGITAQQIATIAPGPPSSANGIAQQLGDLADSPNPSYQVNGLSLNAFYGQIASDFGQQLSNAQNDQTQQTQAVAQAQNLRSHVSGVSLDNEAVMLTDFQRSYEATSKLVTVLNQLTQDTINLIQ